MDNLKQPKGHCPRCGQALPQDAPEGLCAACLFKAGAETLTAGSTGDIPTLSSARDDSAAFSPEGPQLVGGQAWGPYRIGRLLGKGGMGEVYECEHMASGRRIALKVLRDRLQNADQRARFLREGQLAASISHPHTVYIFGSEEIAGMPVISMELLPGGTLKDRVTERGPLSPSEAVSAILDIIGGLDAAQAAGILHRDIKPSNCFLDNDGAVKVGDFGLSISTLARDVRHEFTGFEGTPQFAPPEQLRGEPLDVRADIYAVGATLYYLLTGKTPFDARDLRELVNLVTTEPAKSPRSIRPDIPPGLAAIVLKCLSKAPSGRPASYAELGDAFRPFSSVDDAPARPGLRFLAMVVDSLIIGTAISVWVATTGSIITGESRTSPWAWLFFYAYYLVLESFWGASLGKRLFGLRVTSTSGAAARWRAILWRTTVFYIPRMLITILSLLHVAMVDSTHPVLKSILEAALTAAMFAPARWNNGWAGFHDRQSETRVVSRMAARRRGRTILGSPPAAALPTPAGQRFGPFIATSNAGTTDAELFVAFDPVLRRQVWIHTVPSGTPAVGSARRDVGRAGRLFWLTGHRSANERDGNWDAFEAPDGEPFLKRQGAPRGMLAEWPTLKLWLMDLANELVASAEDGSTPALALDRVWIRNDERLVLLDYPAPGTGPASRADLTPVGLLSAVAASASVTESKETEPPSTPLSARALLDRWAGPAPPSLTEARNGLKDAASSPDRVQRWRRALPIALAAAPSLLLLLITLVVLPTMYWVRDNIWIVSMIDALREPNPPAGSRLGNPEVRDAFEKYLAGTHGATLSSDRFWSAPIMQSLRDRRVTARAILARHPSVPAEELARVTAMIEPDIERMKQRRNVPVSGLAGFALVIIEVLTALALLLAMSCSLVSALVFRAVL